MGQESVMSEHVSINSDALPSQQPEHQTGQLQSPLELEGERELNHKVGGDLPQTASATLKAGSISIPSGQYEKGHELDLVMRVRCSNVSFPDKLRKGLLFTERKHDFEVVWVERVKE